MSKHTAVKLSVIDCGSGQFEIQSDFMRIQGDWDEVYVSISGFFGKFGPHVFSVAPDLRDLLKQAKPYVEDRLHGRDGEVFRSVAKLLSEMDKVIAKAEGRSND